MTVIGSMRGRKSAAHGLRVTRSPSFSSRWISMVKVRDVAELAAAAAWPGRSGASVDEDLGSRPAWSIGASILYRPRKSATSSVKSMMSSSPEASSRCSSRSIGADEGLVQPLDDVVG